MEKLLHIVEISLREQHFLKVTLFLYHQSEPTPSKHHRTDQRLQSSQADRRRVENNANRIDLL